MKFIFTVLLFLPLSLYSQWSQVGNSLYGDAPEDRFGKSIQFNGDATRVAVGAYYNDIGGEDAGQVRVFDYDGTDWTQVGQDIYGQNSEDFTGTRVALNDDGTILAVGIMGFNNRKGRVIIYEEINNSWVPLGNPIEGVFNSFFGQQLELNDDGNILIVAGSSATGNGSENNGLVQVYSYNGADWSQLGQNFYGEGLAEFLGTEVAMNASGTVIAMSAPMHEGAAGVNTGRVYVYQLNGTNWSPLGQIIEGTVPIQEIGRGLALNDDGTKLAIGSPYFDDFRGKVQVYNIVSNIWTLIGQELIGENTGDYFGARLRFDTSGDILAVSAPFNQDNGVIAGLVRLYNYQNNNWIPIGDDIYGESPGDRAGISITLSNDGNTIAVGSLYHDGPNGSDSGHVRVFEKSSLSFQDTASEPVSLYPNPTSDFITLSFGKLYPNASIKVYDVLGSIIVEHQVMNSERFKISTSNLANGLYTILFTTNELQQTVKFIKK